MNSLTAPDERGAFMQLGSASTKRVEAGLEEGN